MEYGINHPDIVAEVRAAFLSYEAALLVNDLQQLNEFFWDSQATVRYGVAEQCYGIAAIKAYRLRATPVDPRRKLINTVIATFGKDSASVCTEFHTPGSASLGRQTQSWMRLAQGWKIVAAHVSTIAVD